MTLVHEVDRGNAPGVHALVVGVGRYPWLVGGDEDPRGREITEGMGQLVSPPVSARAIVDWLLGSYWHPDRRLASVDLLLSDPGNMTYVDPAETMHQVEEATRDRVKAAARAWKQRGRADDLLFFFFCGHGVSAGFEYALLCSDYGADAEQPWEGSIGLPGLVENMRSARASKQIYFVDACRVGSAALLGTQHTFKPDALVGSTLPLNGQVKQAVYYSTLGGAPAFGLIGQTSLFTAALLKALGGAAASDNEDRWAVETTLLQRTLDHLLGELADPVHGLVQTPQMGTQSVFEVVGLQHVPVVPLYIRPVWHEGEDPPDEVVSVQITREGEPLLAWGRPWDAHGEVSWAPSRFRSDLEAGLRYRCVVTFEDGPAFESRAQVLTPPYRTVKVRVDGDADA